LSSYFRDLLCQIFSRVAFLPLSNHGPGSIPEFFARGEYERQESTQKQATDKEDLFLDIPDAAGLD
jgi:hypothetical protein